MSANHSRTDEANAAARYWPTEKACAVAGHTVIGASSTCVACGTQVSGVSQAPAPSAPEAAVR